MGNPSQGQTKIDNPGALKGAGNGAGEVAGQLRAVTGLPVDACTSAAGSLAGDNWDGALGAALRTTVQTWSSQADALVRTCQGIAQKCRQTADNYVRTEQVNEGNFRRRTVFG